RRLRHPSGPRRPPCCAGRAARPATGDRRGSLLLRPLLRRDRRPLRDQERDRRRDPASGDRTASPNPARRPARARSDAMTNERRDDEILGRALSRAIETIEVNQTPYERSRIATAPARRSIFGLWQIATAAAAIVLALAIGSWLTRPTEGQPGVAASPTTSPNSIASSPTTTPAPAVVTPGEDRIWAYFARHGLPPTGA